MRMTSSEIICCVQRSRARYDQQKAMFHSERTWDEYWSVNRRHVLKNGEKFKKLLSPDDFQQYLSDHTVDPWKLYFQEQYAQKAT